MKTAIIIGAGPAGLTAAYELLTKTDIIPILIEADSQVGGLSKTINYKGNKIDIGGHRFFSKSKKVIDWWLRFLPLETGFKEEMLSLQFQNKTTELKTISRPDQIAGKMLVRRRKSRIFYQRKFFDYPLKLNWKTVSNLGFVKMTKIGFSYIRAKIFPIRPEENLEQYFKNHFGNELYRTFFKDYTAKVWGVACKELPSSWGKQRVKDLNMSRVVGHALKSLFLKRDQSLDQSGTSTSLIEQFLYPETGPGQMWETVAAAIQQLGGTILLNHTAEKIIGNNEHSLVSVQATNNLDGKTKLLAGDYFFSTMPVKELVEKTAQLNIPAQVRSTAQSLEYRDFLIVGILTQKLAINEKKEGAIMDNWIYIQDKKVMAGRLQFFHNWSPFMVSNKGDSWLGVEYFCNEQDEFWQLPDNSILELVLQELKTIGILDEEPIKDSIVVRVKNAYPSYYGGYEHFDYIRAYFDRIDNLYLIGRNGMHRYNNSDHSMLTAMAAVDNIRIGRTDKNNIWEINTEEVYHEQAKK